MGVHLWFKPALAGLVIASISLLGACSQGPGAAPTDKEPDPLPTLMGSWQRSETQTRTLNYDDGTETRMSVDSTITLTFTKSRFIWHERAEREDDTVAFYQDSGTWDSNDTTITKTARGWEEGDDRVWRQTDELASEDKEYLWSDAERNTLLVHEWDTLEPSTLFEHYTRLEPLSGGISGVWRTPDETVEATIEDDRIEVSSIVTFYDGSTAPYTFAGDLRHDPAEGFLFITVTNTAGYPLIAEGHELKFAYAQTGSNTVAVSDFHDERTYDEAGMIWVDHTDPPYRAFGNYWINLVKQQ